MAKAAKKKVGKKKAGAKKVVTKKKVAAKKGNGNGESGRTARVIRLKTDKPYKEGSQGAAHFDAMKGGITVGQYLDKFENRKNASQWLGNAIADKHAELLG